MNVPPPSSIRIGGVSLGMPISKLGVVHDKFGEVIECAVHPFSICEWKNCICRHKCYQTYDQNPQVFLAWQLGTAPGAMPRALSSCSNKNFPNRHRRRRLGRCSARSSLALSPPLLIKLFIKIFRFPDKNNDGAANRVFSVLCNLVVTSCGLCGHPFLFTAMGEAVLCWVQWNKK